MAQGRFSFEAYYQDLDSLLCRSYSSFDTYGGQETFSNDGSSCILLRVSLKLCWSLMLLTARPQDSFGYASSNVCPFRVHNGRDDFTSWYGMMCYRIYAS